MKLTATIRRYRHALAFCCALTALIFLWQGITDVSFNTKALAINSLHAKAEPDFDNKRTIALLATTVENLSTSLGVVIQNLPDEAQKRQALQAALNAASLTNTHAVYYTAWQGTTLLHSPLNPHFSGKDYKDFQDSAGTPFIALLAEQACNGVTLHIQPLLTQFERISAQIVHAKTIPHSDWYIAAFLTPQDFSEEKALISFEQHMRRGFLFFGISFACLAILFLFIRPEHSPA